MHSARFKMVLLFQGGIYISHSRFANRLQTRNGLAQIPPPTLARILRQSVMVGAQAHAQAVLCLSSFW